MKPLDFMGGDHIGIIIIIVCREISTSIILNIHKKKVFWTIFCNLQTYDYVE